VNRMVSISRYEEDRNPARLFVYEQSKKTEKVFHDCIELYLIGEDAKKDYDVSIKVQDDFNSQDATFEQFHNMALNIGRYNSAPVGKIPVQIYGAVTPLPATVELNMSGPDSDKVRTLHKKEVLIPSEVSNSTINEAEKLARILRNMERQDPAKAQAYRHRMGLPKSSALQARLNR